MAVESGIRHFFSSSGDGMVFRFLKSIGERVNNYFHKEDYTRVEIHRFFSTTFGYRMMNLRFFKAISEHCKNVTGETEIVDYLHECDDLTIEETDLLLELNGKRNTIQVLLCLMIEDEKLYFNFVRALFKTGQEDIAFKIMAEELNYHPIY